LIDFYDLFATLSLHWRLFVTDALNAMPATAGSCAASWAKSAASAAAPARAALWALT
jgi:hypothetical protein